MSEAGSAPSELPSSVGRYRILARLGGDWIDDVYRGFDPMIERPVAVKVFRLPTADGTAASAVTRTFYREMQRTGGLTHHGIAALFDAGAVPGALFTASEFVEGASLAELVAAGLNLDLRTRVSLVTQIADALEYARLCGVAHLNLKPTNVIVGADHALKLGGFGVAPVVDALASATSQAVLKRTPYGAPERLRGEPGDSRSDVFSLAHLVFDVFADAHESGGPGPHGVTRLPASLAEHGVDPGRWAAVFRRALALDPADRPQTPAALKAELMFVLGTGDTDAPWAWDAPREGGRPGGLGAEESETVLAPSGPPPPHDQAVSRPPAPASSASRPGDEPETILTPPTKPAKP